MKQYTMDKTSSLSSSSVCASEAFLLTGNITDDDSKYEACCAWDFFVWLYSDPKLINETIDIPAFYLTMQESRQLNEGDMVIMYMRDRPHNNISSVLIWALGVLVAAVAAYMSAGDYRFYLRQVLKTRARLETQAARQNQLGLANNNATHPEEGPRSRSRSPKQNDRARSNESEQRRRDRPPPMAPPEESLELNAGHAFGFIFMASAGLLTLFFFKIYSIVKIMYAIGCSGAMTQIVFHPLYWKLARHVLSRPPKALCMSQDFGPITWIDILAALSGYGLGATWLMVGLTTIHPENNPFFWITQDIMGSCMCILFLSIIKLNSLRVASILLLVAFFYDIFFVFVTPLLFKGESVMIAVATSGGPPKADPSWCEKYPSDKDCQGGDPLPMLLTIPRIADYLGGASLLGLGDIVLPGLLLSFAARIDAAKTLVAVVHGKVLSNHHPMRSATCPEDNYVCKCCNKMGYYGPAIVAYAIGLFMANAAVYLMQMGQPALLYLVPCCLGTMCVLAWRRKELTELWMEPRIIRTADAILYGHDDDDDQEEVDVNDDEAPPPPLSADDNMETNQEEARDGEIPLLS